MSFDSQRHRRRLRQLFRSRSLLDHMHRTLHHHRVRDHDHHQLLDVFDQQCLLHRVLLLRRQVLGRSWHDRHLGRHFLTIRPVS